MVALLELGSGHACHCAPAASARSAVSSRTTARIAPGPRGSALSSRTSKAANGSNASDRGFSLHQRLALITPSIALAGHGGAQQGVHLPGVGFAAAGFHHLADQKAQHLRPPGLNLANLRGVGGDDLAHQFA